MWIIVVCILIRIARQERAKLLTRFSWILVWLAVSFVLVPYFILTFGVLVWFLRRSMITGFLFVARGANLVKESNRCQELASLIVRVITWLILFSVGVLSRTLKLVFLCRDSLLRRRGFIFKSHSGSWIILSEATRSFIYSSPSFSIKRSIRTSLKWLSFLMEVNTIFSVIDSCYKVILKTLNTS